MRRRPACLSIAVGLCLVIFGAGTLLFFKLLHGSEDDLKRQLRLAKSEGVPLELNEIEPDLPAKSESATGLLLGALGYTEDPTWQKAFDRLSAAKPSFPAQDRKLLDKLLALSAQPLQLLEAASQKPKLSFGRNWSLGRKLDVEPIWNLKRPIGLLCYKACQLFQNGKEVAAIQELQAAARLCSLLAQDPTWYGLAFSASGATSIERTLESFLPQIAQDRDLLITAQKVVDSFGPPLNVRNALRGEIPISWDRIRTAEALDEPAQSNSAGEFMRVSTIRNRAQARFLETCTVYYRALPKDPLDFRGFEQAVQAADELLDCDRIEYSLACTFFQVRAFSTIVEANEAGRRIMSQGISTLRARLGDGVALALRDPYTDAPLKVRVDKKVYFFYSVGKNKTDEGGIPIGRTITRRSDDIVFRFPKN